MAFTAACDHLWVSAGFVAVERSHIDTSQCETHVCEAERLQVPQRHCRTSGLRAVRIGPLVATAGKRHQLFDVELQTE